MTIAQRRARLETSALYMAREYAYHLTHVQAQLSACWYLDRRFRERYFL